MPSAIIFDIMRFSTRDGPGIRTTVFLKGCPLACLWCHNPESQRPHPELMLRPNLCIGCKECIAACKAGCISEQNGAIITDLLSCTLCKTCAEVCVAEAREVVGQKMSIAEVMAELCKDRIFYEQSGGGVTFSGGEPLLQNDFLLAALQACKAEELHTAIDTCGYVPWEILEAVLPYVDLFLYDLKSIDNTEHFRATGVSNTLILSNLVELSKRGANIRVRIPIIPGINDNPQSCETLGEFLASLPRPAEIELLPYHSSGVEKYRRLNRPYHLEGVQPPSGEIMLAISQNLQRHGLILYHP